MNFKKSILIITLLFFAAMQSQTMVTTNIQSRLLNKYWCPNVGDPYEVVFFFTQNEATLFVGNKKIGSEPYYITSNPRSRTNPFVWYLISKPYYLLYLLMPEVVTKKIFLKFCHNFVLKK